MVFCLVLFCATTALLQLTSVSAVKFSEYILAPPDRSVAPKALYAVHGNVSSADALLAGAGNAAGVAFVGPNSSVTLDFGINIAGTVEFEIGSISGTEEYLGFTFTESSMWISPFQSDSASNATYDSPLWFRIPFIGNYSADKTHQRGGFRYMSIWHNSTGALALRNLRVNFTASPEMADLRSYTGYFNSDSEKLNRVWYAGAYTNQLCVADPAYGNTLGVPGTGWYYNATVANGTSVLMDGAKRDRLVWPGDIIISAPSIFVSTGSLDGIRNGIDSLFVLQQLDGRLPWAGVPFTTPDRFQFSFTYHLYTLLDLYYYYLYTGDIVYLAKYWDQYKLALDWAMSTIDSTGLANVTSSNDWLRSGMGGHNIEANAILYHTLTASLHLSTALNDTAVVSAWASAAQTIKSAANALLWDPGASLFRDNDTSAVLHPQDGNAWAVISGLASPPSRAAAISTALSARWLRPYGAPAPEAGGGTVVSPFVTGFEVQAHYLAGFPERAEQLVEFMWADFMLDDARMTNSSFVEGYSATGALRYAPYDELDARISHAHGWSTGPTSALTFLGAGLQVTGAAGRTWAVRPRLGALGRVEAGFATRLGEFSAEWWSVAAAADEGGGGGGLGGGAFRTPEGTAGVLVLPERGAANWSVVGPTGVVRPSGTGDGTVLFEGLPGGSYTVMGA